MTACGTTPTTVAEDLELHIVDVRCVGSLIRFQTRRGLQATQQCQRSAFSSATLVLFAPCRICQERAVMLGERVRRQLSGGAQRHPVSGLFLYMPTRMFMCLGMCMFLGTLAPHVSAQVHVLGHAHWHASGCADLCVGMMFEWSPPFAVRCMFWGYARRADHTLLWIGLPCARLDCLDTTNAEGSSCPESVQSYRRCVSQGLRHASAQTIRASAFQA